MELETCRQGKSSDITKSSFFSENLSHMSARVLECLTKYFTVLYEIAQSFYFSFMSSCITTVHMHVHLNLDKIHQIFSKSLSLHSAMFAGLLSGPVCHLLSLYHTPTAGLSGAPGVS
jgi:hypothetical protein